jgi:hypothetical protein
MLSLVKPLPAFGAFRIDAHIFEDARLAEGMNTFLHSKSIDQQASAQSAGKKLFQICRWHRELVPNNPGLRAFTGTHEQNIFLCRN